MFVFLVTLHIVALVFLFFELVYIILQRPSRIQNTLIVLIVATIVTLLGYQMEILAKDSTAAWYGCCIAYVGKPFALLGTATFIMEYCGYEPKKWVYVLWAAESCFITAMVLTNNYHHLYYSTAVFNCTTRTFSKFDVTHGPVYYLYAANSAFDFGISLFFIIRDMKRRKVKEIRMQNMLLIAVLTCTLLGYTIYLLGITDGYDTTMIGAMASAFIVSLLFIRYRFFDYVSLAKEKALYDAASGLIVIGPSGETEYTNGMTDNLIAKGVKSEEFTALPEGVSVINRENKYYEVRKKTILDKGIDFGHTVELTDITERHNYSKQLEQEVEKRTKEVVNIQRSVIASFAGIVEARDSETGAHVNRIKSYVKAIALQLKKDNSYCDILTDDFIDVLEGVAPLHDIGKLSIPDSVLKKDDRLTDEEYEIIKKHTVYGANIISECLEGVERPAYVEMAKQVALLHHEKYNGTGYPYQLCGKSIPLAARITAVADVYDALRSARRYKPPMEVFEARRIIAEGSGSSFDPVVVDAFMKVLPVIEEM